jgi:GntR family transcriptional regulator
LNLQPSTPNPEPLRRTGIPLYHQLREIFTEKIESGEWKPGDLLPNEPALCRQYGVSRGPVRQALEHLVREGLLSRKQGKGTWVLPPKIERGLGGFYSFTTLIEQRGLRPGTRLLSFETAAASVGVARALALAEGEPVFKIRRLRLADDEPLILETVCVPARVCPDLTEAALEAAPLYDLMRERYGVTVLRARQFLEPAIADEYEAGALGIDQGAPVLLLQNITYAAGDRPVVFSKAVMRGDRVRYYVELSQAVVAPA